MLPSRISSLIAAALIPASALAQATSGPGTKAPATAPDNLPQKIQEQLGAQGFTDIRVEPTSYLFSARDKDGNQIMILIGPDSMTMLTIDKSADPRAGNPSIADKPQGKDKEKLIQQ